MDRPALLCLRSRFLIYRITQQIKYTAQALIAYWYGDGAACIHRVHAAHQSVCRAHGNASHYIVTHLLGNLCHQAMTIYINLNRIKQCRQFSLPETDIQDRTRYLHYLANMFLSHI